LEEPREAVMIRWEKKVYFSWNQDTKKFRYCQMKSEECGVALARLWRVKPTPASGFLKWAGRRGSSHSRDASEGGGADTLWADGRQV